MCTKNHVMYGSWDTEWDRHNILSFWAIFCSFNSPKNQNFKKIYKKKPGDIINLHMCTKNDQFLRYAVWWTDGRKKWHIEVGAQPKNWSRKVPTRASHANGIIPSQQGSMFQNSEIFPSENFVLNQSY